MSGKIFNICVKQFRETVETIKYNNQEVNINICKDCNVTFKLNLKVYNEGRYWVDKMYEKKKHELNNYNFTYIDEYHKYIYFCKFFNLKKEFDCELCIYKTHLSITHNDKECCIECYDKIMLWNKKRDELLYKSFEFEKELDYYKAVEYQKEYQGYTKKLSELLRN